jgi:hypothetical protein
LLAVDMSNGGRGFHIIYGHARNEKPIDLYQVENRRQEIHRQGLVVLRLDFNRPDLARADGRNGTDEITQRLSQRFEQLAQCVSRRLQADVGGVLECVVLTRHCYLESL